MQPLGESGVGPASGAATSRIHDLGYRHYDGARLGRRFVARSLFVHCLRGAYGLGRPSRAKVLPFAILAVMVAPAIISVGIISFLPVKVGLIPYAQYVLTLQAAAAIFLASQAPQAFSRELRFRTVSLYFSRPLSRLDYVLAKIGALAAALYVLFALPLTILFIGALLNKFDGTDQIKAYAASMLGAVFFAVLLAALGAAIASATPRRGLGVAAVIAVYLVSYGAVSVLQGILIYADRNTTATYLGLFSPFTLVEGFQSWALHMKFFGAGDPPSGAGGALFVLGVAVVIAASVAVTLLRHRKAGR